MILAPRTKTCSAVAGQYASDEARVSQLLLEHEHAETLLVVEVRRPVAHLTHGTWAVPEPVALELLRLGWAAL